MVSSNKVMEAFEAFSPVACMADVTAAVNKLVGENYERNNTQEVYKFLYGTIDLTTLMGGDTEESVSRMVMHVNDHEGSDPTVPNVAAICVYPALVPVVRETLTASGVRVACVAGGFPASQTFVEVKVAETALSVSAGADEVDIVLNLNRFQAEDYEACATEIEEIKEACRGAHLKVILESGFFKEAEDIRRASILSLFAGADFIKTSTGKEYPGASLEAAYIMCHVLKEYYEKYGERKGIKFSGGIRSTEEAVKYYCIVEQVLGKEWMTPDLFRIGASSLEGNLLKSINQ